MGYTFRASPLQGTGKRTEDAATRLDSARLGPIRLDAARRAARPDSTQLDSTQLGSARLDSALLDSKLDVGLSGDGRPSGELAKHLATPLDV